MKYLIKNNKKQIDKKTQEQIEAEYILGKMYKEGMCGIAKDIDMAIEHFRKAAEMGHGESMLEIGLLYMFDKNNCKKTSVNEILDSAKINRHNACIWFKRAKDAGVEKAEWWYAYSREDLSDLIKYYDTRKEQDS